MTALRRRALRPLVDELARRIEEGQMPATIAVPDECRPEVADLLGMDRFPASGWRLRVSRLTAALGLIDTDGLRIEVETVVGPLRDMAVERRVARSEREDLWEWLGDAAAEVDLGRPLDDWVISQRARGVRGGVRKRRGELSRALNVLSRLPADGVALASLAADLAGGPHALDHGRTLSAMVLDAVAVATGSDRPTNAEAARALWESVGVAPDPLSSNVLALGLPGSADPLGFWLNECRAASEPVSLTLANLRRWPRPPLGSEEPLFVVENPSLIAEAAGRPWNGPPLVCSSGRPTVGVVTLLRQLGADGAPMFQHADFDPAGIAITAWLQERARTQPWLMTAEDYLRGARSSERTFSVVPDTPWDLSLQTIMAARGAALYEEDVRDELLSRVLDHRTP